MLEQTLLSDLCGVCYSNPPKYKCPRCAAKTCSLPCYQRHQQRASCNGKRDPSAFVPKSRLTTAEGVDRDYNFLAGVERAIDHADRDAEDRGTITNPPHPRDIRHPDGALSQYLHANNIIVDRAPKGMSRRKVNHTRITKSRSVMWTLEWVEAGVEKTVKHDNLESRTLSDLYEDMMVERRHATSRKEKADREATRLQQRSASHISSPKPARKKRRRDSRVVTEGGCKHDMLEHQCKLVANFKQDETELASSMLPPQSDVDVFQRGRDALLHAELDPTQDSKPIEAETRLVGVERRSSSNGKDSSPLDGNETPLANTTAQNGAGQALSSQRPSLSPSNILMEKAQQPPSPTKPPPTTPQHTPRKAHQEPLRHFYLLKPGTASASRVLIPASGQATLTDTLRGQTVAEFPTLHVLHAAPDSLPAAFELGEKYTAAKMLEEAELEGLLETIRPESAVFGPEEPSLGAVSLDERAILEMLRRDVGV